MSDSDTAARRASLGSRFPALAKAFAAVRIGLSIDFLSSYVNPQHEIRAKEIIQARYPGLFVTASHEVTSLLGENRRWTTAMLNCFVHEQAHAFLEKILPEAPDVPVQIAHMAGAGPGYEDAEDSALVVYLAAIKAHDPRMKNVWFDATVIVRPAMSPDELQRIAARIRQIGVERVLYGSDAPVSALSYPKAGWAAFQRLPLTAAEFRVIANNITPYMRDFAVR